LVNTGKEVDAMMKRAKRAGGKIVKAAQKTFWGGYAGYFQDPDGHLWGIPPAKPSQFRSDIFR
jgi:uncharacterized glyoxalase superfamily protein PhnB